MSKSSQSCWASHKTAIDGVCAHTRTHRHQAIISFSFGYCCHRQFFPLLPLYSLGACIGRIVWKLVMGEMGACVILSFHCPFPLYFFIPLTISLFCLPSCLLFLPRSLTVWPSCRSNSHPSLMTKMAMHSLSRLSFLPHCHFCSFCSFSLELRRLYHVSLQSVLKCGFFHTRDQGNVGGRIKAPGWLEGSPQQALCGHTPVITAWGCASL